MRFSEPGPRSTRSTFTLRCGPTSWTGSTDGEVSVPLWSLPVTTILSVYELLIRPTSQDLDTTPSVSDEVKYWLCRPKGTKVRRLNSSSDPLYLLQGTCGSDMKHLPEDLLNRLRLSLLCVYSFRLSCHT